MNVFFAVKGSKRFIIILNLEDTDNHVMQVAAFIIDIVAWPRSFTLHSLVA